MVRPDRKDEPRRFSNLAGVRQWIDSVNDTLKGQLDLERHGGRTPRGEVAAVGATWYGPDRDNPALQVTTPAGTACGSMVRLDHGLLVLRTKAGEVASDLTAPRPLPPWHSARSTAPDGRRSG